MSYKYYTLFVNDCQYFPRNLQIYRVIYKFVNLYKNH